MAWRSQFHTRARYVFERSKHGEHQGGGYKVDIPLDPVLAQKKMAGAPEHSCYARELNESWLKVG